MGQESESCWRIGEIAREISRQKRYAASRTINNPARLRYVASLAIKNPARLRRDGICAKRDARRAERDAKRLEVLK